MVIDRTFARGARQLVVQLALEMMLSSGLYSFSLTPTTNIGASLLGAEMMTFFAPPWESNQTNSTKITTSRPEYKNNNYSLKKKKDRIS